jgi:lipoprotein-anchoring transpeptidase ErfK/SrfK
MRAGRRRSSVHRGKSSVSSYGVQRGFSTLRVRVARQVLAFVDLWPGLLWRFTAHRPPPFDAAELQAETVVAISLRRRRLYLFERGALRQSYPVAVGGWRARTPRGRFRVGTRLRHPNWVVPGRRERYGELAGTVVAAGDARNRLGPRWIQLSGGVGIHGGSGGSVGRGWTGGCVRMDDDALIELFEIVPTGTPVLVD